MWFFLVGLGPFTKEDNKVSSKIKFIDYIKDINEKEAKKNYSQRKYRSYDQSDRSNTYGTNFDQNQKMNSYYQRSYTNDQPNVYGYNSYDQNNQETEGNGYGSYYDQSSTQNPNSQFQRRMLTYPTSQVYYPDSQMYSPPR